MLLTEPKPELDQMQAYYDSQEYISHTDSKSGLIAKLYQRVKKVSLKQKRRLINRYKPNKGVLLDIGAGTGDFLHYMKHHSWKVQGVEPNKQARNIAASKGLMLDKNTEEYSSKSVDIISLWHVLEHVYDVEDQIKELKRLLKKDGLIVLAVPNYKSYDAKKYKSFWAAYDVPRHLYHFSKTSITKLFNQYGFEVIKIKPMLFDAFYVSLLSEKYKQGKFNYLKSFYIGLASNINAIFSGEYSALIYVIRTRK